MWICLNNAFVSAVADPRDDTVLKVRARKRIHLKRLFPEIKIYESRKTDYRFRCFVPRVEFASVIARAALMIDYGNFKNSVKDARLHALYADFWDLHREYQEEGGKPQGKPPAWLQLVSRALVTGL